MNRMRELNVHKQHDVGVPSLLDSVIMFCHMCNSAYMLCECMHVCVCKCSRMVKVHLHNIYWYICIRVCEPSIVAYSV